MPAARDDARLASAHLEIATVAPRSHDGAGDCHAAVTVTPSGSWRASAAGVRAKSARASGSVTRTRLSTGIRRPSSTRTRAPGAPSAGRRSTVRDAGAAGARRRLARCDRGADADRAVRDLGSLGRQPDDRRRRDAGIDGHRSGRPAYTSRNAATVAAPRLAVGGHRHPERDERLLEGAHVVPAIAGDERPPRRHPHGERHDRAAVDRDGRGARGERVSGTHPTAVRVPAGARGARMPG